MSGDVKVNAGVARGTGATGAPGTRIILEDPGSSGRKGRPPGFAAAIGTGARSKASQAKAEQARALAAKDFTQEQIAEAIDRSPRQVSRYLKPDPT